MSDDDRPRKSWREIDQQKDRSSHRPEKSGPGGKKDPRRQRSYRAQLDRLFDSGKIGDLVAHQTPEGEKDEASENRLKAHRTIVDAEGRPAVTKAVDAYLKSFGDLPADFDVLGRVLEHRNPSRQLDAMELMIKMLDEEKPRRPRAIIAQLKLIRDTSDETDLIDMSKQLLDILD